MTHCEVADSSSVHSRQTIGLLIAAIVVNATKDYDNASCYQIPIGIQVRELPAPLWTIHACSRLGETSPFLGRVEQAIDAFRATPQQFVWAAILGVGLFALPESPRWLVLKGHDEKARRSLARLFRLPVESPVVDDELANIVASVQHEQTLGSVTYAELLWKSSPQRLPLRVW